MNTRRRFLSFLLCTGALPSFADDKTDADGFTLLFDGKTLAGWRNPFD